MSTLSVVRKGIGAISAPQLIGADLGTRGGEFWNFNGPGGFDFKFTYTGHHSSLTAFKKCPPLNAVIMKKAQAYVNGKTWIVNKKGKGKEKEATNPLADKIRALLKKPNFLQSQKEFEAQLYIYTQLFGFSICLPIKPVGMDNTEATRLWNLPPSMLDIEETKKSWLLAKENKDLIKSIVINFGNEKTTIPVSDIYIFKDFTPSLDSPVFPESRVCPLEMPINNIIGAYESRNVLINYRGALGIISSDAKDSSGFIPIKEGEKLDLQNDFRRYGLTRQQWQFIITSAAVKWTQMGVATKDLMLFEEIDDDMQRICDGYNYPYRLFSSEKTNSLGGSDLREWKKELYEGAIIPEGETIMEQWDNFFELEKYNMRMEKDYSHVPCLQADKVQKATASLLQNQSNKIQYEAGLITLNEWLISMDQDPIGPLGDVRSTDVKNSNVPLATIIGVGGVQSLLGVLSASNLSQEARSATLQILFGISPENAAIMAQGSGEATTNQNNTGTQQ